MAKRSVNPEPVWTEPVVEAANPDARKGELIPPRPSVDPLQVLMTGEVPISQPNEHGVFETTLDVQIPLPGKAFLIVCLARSEAEIWHAEAYCGIHGARDGCFSQGGLPNVRDAVSDRREAVLVEIAAAIGAMERHADRHGDAKRAQAALIRFRNEVQVWQDAPAVEPPPAVVPMFTPSQAHTIWAQPPATTPMVMDARVLQIHPMLERITMLPEVMARLGQLKVRKPEHDDAGQALQEDWDAFTEDVRAHGVLERLKVCEVDGKWLVADGRHRRDAALQAGRFIVPVEVVSEEQALKIIHATVIARRSWTKGMKAYFGVLMYPDVIKNTKGTGMKKRSDSIGTLARSDSDSVGIGITRVELARKCGVSADLIDQACEVFAHCERSKKIREKFEWRVFTGELGLGGILAGIGAELAGEEEETLNGRGRVETPLKHLCAGLDKAKRYLADWDGLTEAQRETAATAFTAFLDAAPPELLQLVTDRTAAATAQKPKGPEKRSALKP